MLCIGNSFSVDATEKFLLPLFNEADEQIEIVNLYRTAANLNDVLNSILTDSVLYEAHYPVAPGVVNIKKDVTVRQMLTAANWDIVTVQQCSELSGFPNTYRDLRTILPSIEETNPESMIFFHQTWPYAQWFEGKAFRKYSYSMGLMYSNIKESTKNLQQTYPAIYRIIPAGTALQNGRIAFNAVKQLSRDGCHLDSLGCFVAACTWFESLTDKDVRLLMYKPDFLSNEGAALAKECAHAACFEPFKVTSIKSDIGKSLDLRFTITNLPELLIFKPNTTSTHHLRVISLEGRTLYEADVNSETPIRVPPGVKVIEIDRSIYRKYLF